MTNQASSKQDENAPENQLPPHSIEAEQALIGSLVIDPQGMKMLPEALHPEHFYRDAHRTIFAAMRTLHDGGNHTDLVNLTDELERNGKLIEVGDADYIVSLVNRVPSSANIKDYADIVLGRAIDRYVMATAAQLAAGASIGQTAAAISAAETRLAELRDLVAGEKPLIRTDFEVVEEFRAEMHGRIAGTITDIYTGFRDVDEWTGGFRRRELVTIAAQSSVGKTIFAVSLADSMARQGHRVCYGTLEMNATDLIERTLAAHANEANQEQHPQAQKVVLDTRLVARGFRHTPNGPIDEEMLALAEETLEWRQRNISENAFWIDREITLKRLGSVMRQAKEDYGCDVMIIDQAQHVTHDLRNKNSQEALAAIVSEGKNQARKRNMVLIFITQILRKTEDERPTEADIKGSGSFFETSDHSWILYRGNLKYPYRQGIDVPLYEHVVEILGVKSRRNARNVRFLGLLVPEETAFRDWPVEQMSMVEMYGHIYQREQVQEDY